jgi:hypothetical protein
MPTEIRNLRINEVSLVDNPANAEVDPRTGQKIPRATVAIWKRDDSDSTGDKPIRKENNMELPKLKEILKSDNPARAQICGAVRRKAAKVAKKKGISIEKAESLVWRKNPEAMVAYDAAPAPVFKRAPRFALVTKAETTLDARTRKRMKRTGESYPAALRAELEADPVCTRNTSARRSTAQLSPSPNTWARRCTATTTTTKTATKTRTACTPAGHRRRITAA